MNEESLSSLFDDPEKNDVDDDEQEESDEEEEEEEEEEATAAPPRPRERRAAAFALPAAEDREAWQKLAAPLIELLEIPRAKGTIAVFGARMLPRIVDRPIVDELLDFLQRTGQAERFQGVSGAKWRLVRTPCSSSRKPIEKPTRAEAPAPGSSAAVSTIASIGDREPPPTTKAAVVAAATENDMPKNKTDGSAWVSTAEAQEMLALSNRTKIYALINKGLLEVRGEGREREFSRASIDRYRSSPIDRTRPSSSKRAAAPKTGAVRAPKVVARRASGAAGDELRRGIRWICDGFHLGHFSGDEALDKIMHLVEG